MIYLVFLTLEKEEIAPLRTSAAVNDDILPLFIKHKHTNINAKGIDRNTESNSFGRLL